MKNPRIIYVYFDGKGILRQYEPVEHKSMKGGKMVCGKTRLGKTLNETIYFTQPPKKIRKKRRTHPLPKCEIAWCKRRAGPIKFMDLKRGLHDYCHPHFEKALDEMRDQLKPLPLPPHATFHKR